MGRRRSLLDGVKPRRLHLRDFGAIEESWPFSVRLLLLEEEYNIAGEYGSDVVEGWLEW